MPKFYYGVLIKCEKTIKMFIKNLDKDKTIIIKDLDDNHLVIDEKKLEYVQEEVYKMQDENAYNPLEVIR